MKLLILLLSFSTYAFDGVYVVPTDSPFESDFASNPVENISFSADALSFKLPAQIGSPQALLVKFERDEKNSNVFKSVFGESKCLQESFTKIKCTVEYNKIYANFLQNMMPETERHLHDLNLSPEEFQARLDIARRFSGDPIGFLEFDIY